MASVELRVLGCGDAFGSGARFQTCFHLKSDRHSLLLDCGASSLIAMQRFGVDPGAIEAIVLSHLHGDHFGGLPFFLLHAHYVAKRRRGLAIAGPAGMASRINAALEVLFPGSATLTWRFPLQLIELTPGQICALGGLRIMPFAVDHPSGAPALGLRLRLGRRTIGYTGDTAWSEALIEIARQADLFIAECYSPRGNGKHHLDWQTLRQRAPELAARRILLSHMSASMLAELPKLDLGPFEPAQDGLTITL